MIHHKHQTKTPSNQSGFTILESLVAILVAAILLVAIAPVIVISVATRMQAKRIETATDAAKTYIDGVRSKVILPPPAISTLQADCSSKEDPKAAIACQTPPPTGTLNCTAQDTIAPNYCSSPTTSSYCEDKKCSTNLYCVDLDGKGCSNDSSKNFIIHAFRYNKVSNAATTQNYQLGVRVYRANGFSSDGGSLKKASDPPDPSNPDDLPNKQRTFTGGLGDRKAPLVEMTTEITKGVTFGDLCDRLKQTNDQSNCGS